VVLKGTATPLGNGSLHSWVSFDEDGKPTAVGVTFSETALAGPPVEPPPGFDGTEYDLALPAETNLLPFDHIMVNWNPHGHHPAHIYDVAHFDFHFYFMSADERRRIPAKGDDLLKCRKQPAATYVPAGYIFAPDSEMPQMGSHWVDLASHEFHGAGFTSTFIWGSYDGKVIFVEPMISKTFLEARTTVSQRSSSRAAINARAIIRPVTVSDITLRLGNIRLRLKA
jgi:Hypothetical protein TTHB210